MRNYLAYLDWHQKTATQSLQIIIHCKQYTSVIISGNCPVLLLNVYSVAVIAVCWKHAAVTAQFDF